MQYPTNPADSDGEITLIILREIIKGLPISQKQQIIVSLESKAKEMQDSYANGPTGNKLHKIIQELKK